jgi:hypothetical protein
MDIKISIDIDGKTYNAVHHLDRSFIFINKDSKILTIDSKIFHQAHLMIQQICNDYYNDVIEQI